MGCNTRLGRGAIINGVGGVIVGDNVRIGPNLLISSSDHIFKERNILISKQGCKLSKVIIKNNVWIGANVSIMSGVSIGEGVVIAAGAVVTKDAPDYAVMAGVPARLIRLREAS